jgi:ATP-dependent helicase HrpA
MISIGVQDLAQLLPPLLKEINAVRRMLEASHPPALAPLVDDLQEQLSSLTAPDFLSRTPGNWLQQYPRYLQGMQQRFAKATTGGFQKDRRNQDLVAPHWRRYLQARERLGREWSQQPAAIRYRFLIEEFRVSLFAQQLRTAVPVSEKRLNEVWQEIRL